MSDCKDRHQSARGPVLPSYQSLGVDEDLAGYEERTNHIYRGDSKFHHQAKLQRRC
jgi:hypothetical protein